MAISNRFACCVLACFLAFVRFCEAREEPSFELEQAAWNATHVVVVSRDQDAGAFHVLETWKGDLKPNDEVTLESFVLPAELRTIADGFASTTDEVKPVRQVTDKRVVLFLIKKQSGDGLSIRDAPTWHAATGVQVGNEFRPFALIVSAVWIVDGKSFAVQQWRNPGPARMLPLRVSSEKAPHGVDLDESQVKQEVQRLCGLQAELRGAIAIKDLAQRAEVLAPIVKAQSWFAWHEGFAALSDCGAAAVPALCELLADEKLLAHHTEIMNKLIPLKGEPIGLALVNVVEDELKFWKETAPQLPKTWRTREGVAPHVADATLLHSVRLNTALEGLIKHPTADAVEPVRQTRDYWVSLPQLDGNRGRQYVSRLCAWVLGAIENKAP